MADFTAQQVFLLHRLACEASDAAAYLSEICQVLEEREDDESDALHEATLQIIDALGLLRKAGWTPSQLGAARFNRDGVATCA